MIKGSRLHRHKRVRAKVTGTLERPRVSIYKSLRGITVQLVNDEAGETIVEGHVRNEKNTQAATKLGQLIAEKAKKAHITKVVFDRSGYSYHGRIRAIADTLRKAGIQF